MNLPDEPTPPPITSKPEPLTAAQAKLAADNYGLVMRAVQLALRTPAGRALGRDELLSVASQAFTACIPRFDRDLAELSTYAMTMMHFAFLDAYRRAWKLKAIDAVLRAVGGDEAALIKVDLANPLEADEETRKRFAYITSGFLQASFLALVDQSSPERANPGLAEDEVLDAIQAARVRAAVERVAASSPIHAAVHRVCFVEHGGYPELAARLGVSTSTAYRYKQDFADAVCADLGLVRPRSAA